jgi:predicted GIY-YIG superfamily endonuclease
MSKGFGGRSPHSDHIFKVYNLKCADGRYYVGKTNNLKNRLERHQKGEVSFTSSRLPFDLVTYLAFDNEWKAVQMEKYLKSGSGRAFC